MAKNAPAAFGWLLLVLLLAASTLVSSPLSVTSSDVTENTWMSKASMPTARSGLGVAVVNDIAYATGGAFYSYPAPHVSPDIYHEKANERSTPVGYNPIPDDHSGGIPAIYVYGLTASAVTIASIGAFAVYYFAKAKKTKKKAE